MSFLRKKQFEDLVRANTEYKYSTSEIRDVIGTAMNVLKEQLIAGNTIKMDPVGTFKVTVRPSHTARNPQTGETIDVPEKANIKFKASHALKMALAEEDVDRYKSTDAEEEETGADAEAEEDEHTEDTPAPAPKAKAATDAVSKARTATPARRQK